MANNNTPAVTGYDPQKGKPLKKPTVRFNLRTDKKLKSGESPIELIYQISGQRKYYNTGEKIFAANWDAESQQAVTVGKRTAKKKQPGIDCDLLLSQTEVNKLNGILLSFQNTIADIEEAFKTDKFIFSVSHVIDKLRQQRGASGTKKDESSTMLYEFIEKYLNDHSATREPGSLTVYKSMRTHLQRYEQHTGKKIAFDKIDYPFFQTFQNFLIEQHKHFPTIERRGKTIANQSLNNITIAKQLSTVKTFLNYAKMHGANVSDKYKDFKIKKEKLEVIALTDDEFQTLYYFDLADNNRLSKVRDLFCFACTTGLRYSDLNQLRREHIKGDEINITVKKTKELLNIPITAFSRAILNKYQDQHKPLPSISNQRLNDYVKELCELVGINQPIEIVRFRGNQREAIIYKKYELIGVHTARKTFVTLSLEKGMSTEEVMSISGHSDYKSFKRYVHVTEQRKKTVMSKAWGIAAIETKLKAV